MSQPSVEGERVATRVPPLCVDLDGTLIKTDLVWETLIAQVKAYPWKGFLVPFWLLGGKAHFKQRLAEGVTLDCDFLPYTPELIKYLEKAHADGRELVLVSACDRAVGIQIAEHLGFFNEVITSDGKTNVRGETKAQILNQRFGEKGFDYAGNERADIPVWAAARERLAVNAPAGILRHLAQDARPLQSFAPQPGRVRALVRSLRCHQWSKNLLVLLPLVAAHAYNSWPAVVGALLMFVAWCLVASGIYVSNDLLDLEADRRHPTKRFRPFTSGVLPLHWGLVMAPALLAVGLGIAAAISTASAAALGLYILAAFAYSFHMKKKPLVDVFILAFLFTIRVVGGGLASGYPVTTWLLSFTSFLFLGLAFLKRCSELIRIQSLGRKHLGSRGYGVVDLPVLQMFGVASAFTSIMVLGLYLNSAVAETHYRWPNALWAVVPFLLLWLCRLWLATVRGEMHDDPIVYSMKDKISWILGAGVLAAFAVATFVRPI